MKSVPTSPTLDEENGEPAAHQFRLNRFRLAAASIWTLVIMALCWLPGSMVNEIERGSSWFKIPDLDKVVHAGIFVVFSVLWLGVWTARRRFLWVALGGIGFAILTEVVQNIPSLNRDGSVNDALTDALGIVAGIFVAPLVEPAIRFAASQIFRITRPKNPARLPLSSATGGLGKANPE